MNGMRAIREFEAECEEHIGYFINNKFELEDAVKAIVG